MLGQVKIRIKAYPERAGILAKYIEKNVDSIIPKLEFIAEETKSYMQQYIISNTHRQPATGNLANSIVNQSTVPNTSLYVIYIGLISELPVYWYVINYGKKFTGEDFVPGGGKPVRGDFNGEPPRPGTTENVRMTYPGKHLVQAEKAVTGMRYIQETYAWLQLNLATLLGRQI